MSTRGRSPTSRTRTRLTGLLAGLALLGIVVGLPLTLLAVGAAPVPHALPSLDSLRSGLSTRDDGTLALALITLVGWAAWAFLSLAILLDLSNQMGVGHHTYQPDLTGQGTKKNTNATKHTDRGQQEEQDGQGNGDPNGTRDVGGTPDQVANPAAAPTTPNGGLDTPPPTPPPPTPPPPTPPTPEPNDSGTSGAGTGSPHGAGPKGGGGAKGAGAGGGQGAGGAAGGGAEAAAVVAV